jgi:hypothetical protein
MAVNAEDIHPWPASVQIGITAANAPRMPLPADAARREHPSRIKVSFTFERAAGGKTLTRTWSVARDHRHTRQSTDTARLPVVFYPPNRFRCPRPELPARSARRASARERQTPFSSDDRLPYPSMSQPVILNFRRSCRVTTSSVRGMLSRGTWGRPCRI